MPLVGLYAGAAVAPTTASVYIPDKLVNNREFEGKILGVGGEICWN